MLISQQVTGLTRYTCMEVANTRALHLVIIDGEKWSVKRGYNSIKMMYNYILPLLIVLS